MINLATKVYSSSLGRRNNFGKTKWKKTEKFPNLIYIFRVKIARITSILK